jgi:archaellum biogenesis protein FlaJ (TadC family)
MLKELYYNKTEKQLKYYLDLYSGLLISCVVMPIIFATVSYFLNSKQHFDYVVPFILVMIWSIINIIYLKKMVNNNNNNEKTT